jgi:hypothetical protein
VCVLQGVRKEDPKTKQPILYDIEDKINFAVFPGLQVSEGVSGAQIGDRDWYRRACACDACRSAAEGDV